MDRVNRVRMIKGLGVNTPDRDGNFPDMQLIFCPRCTKQNRPKKWEFDAGFPEGSMSIRKGGGRKRCIDCQKYIIGEYYVVTYSHDKPTNYIYKTQREVEQWRKAARRRGMSEERIREELACVRIKREHHGKNGYMGA